MIIEHNIKSPTINTSGSRSDSNPIGTKVNEWVKKAKVFTLIGATLSISTALGLGLFCVIPIKLALGLSLTLLATAAVAYLVLRSCDKSAVLNRTPPKSVCSAELLEKVADRKILSAQESKTLLVSLEDTRKSLFLKEIEALRQTLKNDSEIDGEVADQIVEFLKNSPEPSLSLFTPESKNEIIQRAKEATHSKKQKFLLEELRLDLEKRAIPADESLIKKITKYKDLFDKKSNTELQNIINQWFLNQELKARKNPALLQHPKVETAVLSGLNYLQANDYAQRARVQKMTEQFILEYMGGENLNCKSLQELKEELEEKLLDIRLEALPKAKNIKSQVKLLIRLAYKMTPLIEQKKSEAQKNLSDEIDNDPLLKPLPLGREVIHKSIQSTFDSADIIYSFFRSLQESLNKKIATDTEEQLSDYFKRVFLKGLDPKILSISNSAAKYLTDLVIFYRRWSKNIAVEAIQGLKDSQEVLGNGACYALSCNYAVLEQTNPDITLEELKIGEIRPDHRFKQAWLSEAKRIENQIIPNVLIKSLGMNKSEVIVRASTSQNFKKLYLEKFNDGTLQTSNGVTIGALYFKKGGGHAIHLRADKVRNKYHLQDPNLGLLAIPYDSTKTPEEHVQILLEAMDDLLNRFYSDVDLILINQLT